MVASIGVLKIRPLWRRLSMSVAANQTVAGQVISCVLLP